MRTLDQLAHLRSIGAILAFFGIADTAGVAREHGARILALWAAEVATIDQRRPAPPEVDRLSQYGTALRDAYEAVARPARRGARGWVVIAGGHPAR